MSLILHATVAAVLLVVLAAESGERPPRLVHAEFFVPVRLEDPLPPPPPLEPPEVRTSLEPEAMPEEVDLEEVADPRFEAGEAPLAALAGPDFTDGVAFLGAGNGGLRIRPRASRGNDAPAAGPTSGSGEGNRPSPGPTVRARPREDACEEPDYPGRERRLGVEGAVVLVVRIDPVGVVASVEVQVSSGSPELDAAAKAAVERWRFSPALRDGTPVEDTLRLRVRFSLVDARTASDSRN